MTVTHIPEKLGISILKFYEFIAKPQAASKRCASLLRLNIVFIISSMLRKGTLMRLEEKGVADADEPCSGSDELHNLKFFLIVSGSCCQNDCSNADCGDDQANSGLYGKQGVTDADSDIAGVDAESRYDVEAHFLDAGIANQEHQAQSQQTDSSQNHKDDHQQI